MENNVCDTLLTRLRSHSIWGSRKLQGLCAKQKTNTDEPGTIQHNRTEAAKSFFYAYFFFNPCIRYNKTWSICGPAAEAEKTKQTNKKNPGCVSFPCPILILIIPLTIYSTPYSPETGMWLFLTCAETIIWWPRRPNINEKLQHDSSLNRMCQSNKCGHF